MSRLLLVAAVLLVLTPVPGQTGTTQPKPAKSAGWGDNVELLLMDAPLVRVQLRVEIDTQPAGAVWDRSIQALFDFLDRDGDGSLSPAEASRMPTPFDVRRILWGNFYPPTGIGENWKTADTNNDGKLGRDEVIAFYQRHGVGVQVGAVRLPGTEGLNAALLKQLDRDGDGKISVAELKTSEKSLAALDLNEDELISASELIRGMSYPGSIGAIRLDIPSASAKLPMPSDPAMWLLPANIKDTNWATALRNALVQDDKLPLARSRMDAKEFAALDTDGDGSLSVEELARWRARPGTRAWIASFSKKEIPKLSPTGELNREGIRLTVRTDSGKLGEMWGKSRQQFINQFVAADSDRAGFLDDKSSFALKDRGLKLLLAYADRDGDGKLTRAELDAWLKLMDELTQGQILVTVLDHGKGLFESLDADSDGTLSVRELRTAAARMEKSACIRDGFLDMQRPPRTIRLAVSHGHPKSSLPLPKRSGPDWFLAMDRNGDGDVSRREWVGDPAIFDRYDLDRDGLLRAEEAERVVLKQK